MIRRLFYFCLGVWSAVWAMRKLQSLQPDHVARRTVGSLRELAAEVRSAAASRETELRARYGLGSLESTSSPTLLPGSAGRHHDIKES